MPRQLHPTFSNINVNVGYQVVPPVKFSGGAVYAVFVDLRWSGTTPPHISMHYEGSGGFFLNSVDTRWFEHEFGRLVVEWRKRATADLASMLTSLAEEVQGSE